jgi:hypothetical protein
LEREPAWIPVLDCLRLSPRIFTTFSPAVQPIGFFEVHAENYIGAGGPPHAQHGVCASNDQREVWLKSALLGNRLVATSESIRIA